MTLLYVLTVSFQSLSPCLSPAIPRQDCKELSLLPGDRGFPRPELHFSAFPFGHLSPCLARAVLSIELLLGLHHIPALASSPCRVPSRASRPVWAVPMLRPALGWSEEKEF